MVKLAQVLLVVPCLVGLTSADFIRFSITDILSIEPREWDTDHLQAHLNLVTRTQNITSHYLFDDWPRGRHTTPTDVWKDVPVTSSDPTVTLAFAIFNTGDKDPQDKALSE